MQIIGANQNQYGTITFFYKMESGWFYSMAVKNVFGAEDALTYVPQMSEQQFKDIKNGLVAPPAPINVEPKEPKGEFVKTWNWDNLQECGAEIWLHENKYNVYFRNQQDTAEFIAGGFATIADAEEKASTLT
jgi:hypothetical protein